MMDLGHLAQPQAVPGELQVMVMRAGIGGNLIGMHQPRLGEGETSLAQHDLSQVANQLVPVPGCLQVSIEQVLVELFSNGSLCRGHRPSGVVINPGESLEQFFQLAGREGITSFQREMESQMILVPESGSPTRWRCGVQARDGRLILPARSRQRQD
jgi:hypothetical protein